MIGRGTPKLPREALELLDFWKKARGSNALPHRKNIDPIKLGRWLGDLSMLDVHSGAKRFYVRLHGTMTSENIGQNFTRKYLEDCTPDHALDLAVQPYQKSIEHLAPTYSVLVPGLLSGVFNRFERLVLPFTNADPSPDAASASVDRFLVWVGPTEIDTLSCATVYGDVEPTETERASTRDAMQLAVIDPDDPAYDLSASQPRAPRAVARPLAKLA